MTEKIPTDIEVSKVVDPEADDAERVREFCEQQTITSEGSYRQAAIVVAEIKQQQDHIDGIRRSFVDPLNASVKRINDFFRRPLDALKAAEAAMKRKISDYAVETLAERDRLLSEVAKTDNIIERGDILAQAETKAIPKVAGVSVRETWEGQITSMADVVAWAWENNRAILRVERGDLVSYTKAMAGQVDIPGWTPEVKRTVAITASKIK